MSGSLEVCRVCGQSDAAEGTTDESAEWDTDEDEEAEGARSNWEQWPDPLADGVHVATVRDALN